MTPLEDLLSIARTRPLTSQERTELDLGDADEVNPLLLAEALAGGAQRLSAGEADHVFRSAVAAHGSVLQVLVFQAGKLVAAQVFAPGDYALGSDPGCDLVLDDDGLGPCQAFLVFRDGRTTLQNVGGDAELMINGAPKRTTDVGTLDDVALGPFLLKFRIVGRRQASLRAPARKTIAKPAALEPRRPVSPVVPPQISEAETKTEIVAVKPRPGPSLRVRVFWGKSNVGAFGFPFGREVIAGPADSRDVPLYRFALPSDRHPIARCENEGWVARVPRSIQAYRFDANGWRPAEGELDGDCLKIKLLEGKLLRIGDADYSVEMLVDDVERAPRGTLKDHLRSGAALPFGLAGALGAAAAIAVAFMPKYDRESTELTPRDVGISRPFIIPPDKIKKKNIEESRSDKKEKVEIRRADSPTREPVTTPRSKANAGLKAVDKLLRAGPASEAIFKMSKLAGSSKGFSGKGMGSYFTPLVGRPPVSVAGLDYGPGSGGFTSTNGIGGLRGGGDGLGIGNFSSGGVGKGRVVGGVSAPASGFHKRDCATCGDLPKDLIAKVINEHLGEVRNCYERALIKESGLSGKLLLEWVIDTAGRVEEVKVRQATIKGHEVPDCIVRSLESWTFPSPKGGKVIVSYPFLFHDVGTF